MTDYEALKNLLNRFGITNYTFLQDCEEYKTIEIKVDCCDKVEGYIEFITQFTFNKYDQFQTMGIWE